MEFHRVKSVDEGADLRDVILLREVSWNDWWEFETLYFMHYVNADGVALEIGGVKIARLDHAYSEKDGRRTPLKKRFSRLKDSYASIGQDESYYKRLRSLLGATRMRSALKSLQDLALNADRFATVRNQRPVKDSLLRSVSNVTVRSLYAKIIAGGAEATAFDFTFTKPSLNPFLLEQDFSLNFRVVPNSLPPSNVHVLIGRNGSGKTTLLRSMARSLVGAPFRRPGDGEFSSLRGGVEGEIANLVYVAFSAFDEVEVPVIDNTRDYEVPYSYIGLQYVREDKDESRAVESPAAEKLTRPARDLASVFAESAWTIATGKSMDLWRTALEVLESDPNFAAADVSSLANTSLSGNLDGKRFRAMARELYAERLSSGHRIVLLTITRLVETVSERTLVLLDEPEGHLHPPLLSAFMRALSGLLQERNGLAIVATHSPVILQEVPSSCVYSISRSGDVLEKIRPGQETFGENVGTLTHAVFGLEVLASGFSKLLRDATNRHFLYDDILSEFNDEIGFEARILLRTWLYNGDPAGVNKQSSEEDDYDSEWPA